MTRTHQDIAGLFEQMTGDEKHEWAAASTVDVHPDRDRFLLSKGHGPMAYYAVLASKGFPDAGSLGHGLGLGTALGPRAQGRTARTVVLVGDGEHVGSNHEALYRAFTTEHPGRHAAGRAQLHAVPRRAAVRADQARPRPPGRRRRAGQHRRVLRDPGTGRTHQAPGDVALLDTLPGWTVHVPGHPDEEPLLRDALAGDGRVYPRLSVRENAAAYPVDGTFSVLRRGRAGVVLALADVPYRLRTVGVRRDIEVRAYGTAPEHDAVHGLDAPGIAEVVRRAIS